MTYWAAFLDLGQRAWKRTPSAFVLLAFLTFTLVLYRSTLLDLPRSDLVAISAIFQRLSFPADFSRIAFMELLGQPRFQPLAWLLYFFQIKLLGLHFLLYHLVAVGLHAFNGMLLFKLVYSLSKKALFSFLTALFFVSLFTHLPLIAWPIATYSLLSVSLALLAVLSLIKFHTGSRTRFLYLAYALVLVPLFLYELNVIVPAFIFLLSLVLGWSTVNRRQIILKNLPLVAVTYIIYGGLYLGLMPIYAGLPHDVLSLSSWLQALAAVPIEFFNTVFGHNVFASSQVVIDELCFYVPFSVESFSLTTMDHRLVRLNFLVYLALIALVVTLRRPARGRMPWVWLLAAWAIGYTFMLFLGRGVAYVISQGRHAYFPGLLLISVLAFFYERYFSPQWSLVEQKSSSFLTRNSKVIVLVACLFLIGLNIAKTSWTLDRYMDYRAYPNAIYYTARNWLSNPVNQEGSLFISVTTYPPHEKLAWGTDIIPDLFLDDLRITKNFQQATHILEWPEGQTAPVITALEHSPDEKLSDDFALTFGIMPHPIIDEDYLEIFTSPRGNEPALSAKNWWLRLYFEKGTTLKYRQAGIARVVLGYSQSKGGNLEENEVFRSQPVPIGQVQMNHVILVREKKTFGLIVNGNLVEKTVDESGENLQNIVLSLGELYRMGYRQPYYFAHTFMEFGRSRFSIKDKDVGYVFSDIRFNPLGFQEYHLSLNF